MYQSMVVATDGSPTADRAVEAALGLARSLGAKVHVVTAYRPLSDAEVIERRRGVPPREEDEIDETIAARELLERMQKAAANAGVEAEFHAREGDASRAIIDVAREVGADVIVVGNRGMTGVRRLLGSVPNHVAHHAPCSVLIVRTTD